MLICNDVKKVRSRLVNDKVKQGLSERLHDPEQGFSSYIEAKQEYGISYKYDTLRNYMIDIFRTKIK